MCCILYQPAKPPAILATPVEEDVVLFSGLLLLLLSVIYIAFIILARKKQNHLIRQKNHMQEAFEAQLIRSKLETQEETLAALSKELHDNIGQLLNSSKLIIGVARREPSAPVDMLNIAGNTIGKAIQELRALSKSLDKEWLQQFHLIENIQAEVGRVNVSDELLVHFTHSGSLQLDTDAQIILFRIIQEALQNAIKHAQAENIYIDIYEVDALLTVTIKDDGEGFNTEVSQPTGENGLRNMRNRTQLLGGSIGWESRPGAGTRVTIRIPVQNHSA